MNTHHHYRRRDLLKAAGLTAVGGGLGLPGLGQMQAAESNSSKIAISGYKFDRTVALSDGRVAIDGFDHTFEAAGIGDMNTG